MSWNQLWNDLQANFDIDRPSGFADLDRHVQVWLVVAALKRCARQEKNLFQHRFANALEQWRAVNPGADAGEVPNILAALESFDQGITAAAERSSMVADRVRDALDKVDQELEVIVSITPKE